MPSVLITGADRGLGLSLCKEYLNRNYTVFAGKYMEDYDLLENLQVQNPNLHILRIDMSSRSSINAAKEAVEKVVGQLPLDVLISNAALMGEVKCSLYDPPMDLEAPWRSFNVNAIGPLLLTEAMLPVMQTGMKRLCYVSSEVACIALMKHRHDSPFPYPMSKASMNMAVRMMHNQLQPMGYTFRLFHPGWMKFREKDGVLSEKGMYDPDYIGDIAAKYFEKALGDEHRLVMYDFMGHEWTF